MFSVVYVISDINAIWLRLCTTGLRDFFAPSFVAFVLAEAQVLVESFSQNHSWWEVLLKWEACRDQMEMKCARINCKPLHHQSFKNRHTVDVRMARISTFYWCENLKFSILWNLLRNVDLGFLSYMIIHTKPFLESPRTYDYNFCGGVWTTFCFYKSILLVILLQCILLDNDTYDSGAGGALIVTCTLIQNVCFGSSPRQTSLSSLGS